jgi:hypothetical protein
MPGRWLFPLRLDASGTAYAVVDSVHADAPAVAVDAVVEAARAHVAVGYVAAEGAVHFVNVVVVGAAAVVSTSTSAAAKTVGLVMSKSLPWRQHPA